MNARKKIYIHVGPPKTASTTLQHAFYGGRDFLLKRKLLYPDSFEKAYYRTQHADVSNALQARDAEKLRLFADRLMSVCEADGIQKVLLSSESFASITDQETWDYFFSFFHDFDHQFIFVYRRTGDRLVSTIMQMLEGNVDFLSDFESIEECVAAHLRYFDRQERFFEQSNAIFLDFEKLLDGPSLSKSFLEQVFGLDIDLPERTLNETQNKFADNSIYWTYPTRRLLSLLKRAPVDSRSVATRAREIMPSQEVDREAFDHLIVELRERIAEAIAAFNSSETPGDLFTKTPVPEMRPPESEHQPGNPNPPAKLIAFYLPQFHRIPENDRWWGEGFTEWTNVGRAHPNWTGHRAAIHPGELGAYDLLEEGVMAEQVALARSYGIHGFCFHYYWFSGRRLLEKPLFRYIENESLELPFCICWANENWTRRWDGAENEVLIAQTHDAENAAHFAEDTFWMFSDDRYIKVDGKPMLLLYRMDILHDLEETLTIWRRHAKAAGFPDLHVVCARTFNFDESYSHLFDATVEFPPHDTRPTNISEFIKGKQPGFHGFVHSYLEALQKLSAKEYPGQKVYRGVMPGWDNTPRRGLNSRAFLGAAPTLYRDWLKQAVRHAKNELPPGERFVFINAWNEWAEGAVLEPSAEHGRTFLAATRFALQEEGSLDSLLERLASEELGEGQRSQCLSQLREALEMERHSEAIMEEAMAQNWTMGLSMDSKGDKELSPRTPLISKISDRLQRWPAAHRAARRFYRAYCALVS